MQICQCIYANWNIYLFLGNSLNTSTNQVALSLYSIVHTFLTHFVKSLNHRVMFHISAIKLLASQLKYLNELVMKPK